MSMVHFNFIDPKSLAFTKPICDLLRSNKMSTNHQYKSAICVCVSVSFVSIDLQMVRLHRLPPFRCIRGKLCRSVFSSQFRGKNILKTNNENRFYLEIHLANTYPHFVCVRIPIERIFKEGEEKTH